METWRQIPGSLYWASSEGRIRGKHGKILSARTNNQGRARVCPNLYGDGFREYLVHHLVLLAFVGPPPPGHETNHVDGNPLNNKPENLEWVTRSENMLHAYKMKARPGRPERPDGRAKLTPEQVKTIRALYADRTAGNRRTYRGLADQFGVTAQNIYLIVTGQIWCYV